MTQIRSALEAIAEAEKKRFPLIGRKNHHLRVRPTGECGKPGPDAVSGTEKVFANTRLLLIGVPVLMGLACIGILLFMFRDTPLPFRLGTVGFAVLFLGLRLWLSFRRNDFRLVIDTEGVEYRNERYAWQELRETALLYIEQGDTGQPQRPCLVLVFHDHSYRLIELWRHQSNSWEEVCTAVNAFRARALDASAG